MGYYTKFELAVTNSIDAKYIIREFQAECYGASYALNSAGGSTGDVKWHTYENDLKEFSKKYPKALFELEGVGEEEGDMWRLYVHNGKSFKAKAIITYEEFSVDKLQ